MTSFRRQILMAIFKLSDVLIMIGSFIMATIIFSYPVGTISIDEFLHIRIKAGNFILVFVLILLWHITFTLAGLYRSRRLSTLKAEIKEVVKASTIGTFLIYIISILFRISLINPLFLVGFWAATTISTIIIRITLRFMLEQLRRKGHNLRYALIVGTNPRAVRLAQKLESKPELGYKICGFVDEVWHELDEFQKNGYDIVADFEGFAKFISENVVDEVFISLPVKSYYGEISKILNACERQGILARHLSTLFDTKLSNSKLEFVEDESFVSLSVGAMEGWQVPIKRLIDLIVSTIFLILSAPLFLITAFAIKIASLGPVFFVQKRVGLNKRLFRLYKFRTMVEGAEENQAELEDLNQVKGAAFKIDNDPRITPIGKYLRKLSIDEIPQLINVLLGDMSLVGPRPLSVRDYNGFELDWQRRRFSVRPGITCLWQVNGRHNISFEKWMKLDLEYIDKWSLLLDFSILLRTIPAVLRGSGAS